MIIRGCPSSAFDVLHRALHEGSSPTHRYGLTSLRSGRLASPSAELFHARLPAAEPGGSFDKVVHVGRSMERQRVMCEARSR